MDYFNTYTECLKYNYLYKLPKSYNMENEYSKYRFINDSTLYDYLNRDDHYEIYIGGIKFYNYRYTKSWVMENYEDARCCILKLEKMI